MFEANNNFVHSIVPMSPPRHMTPHPMVPTATPASAVDDSQLADTIHSIASPDLNVSHPLISKISQFCFWDGM